MQESFLLISLTLVSPALLIGCGSPETSQTQTLTETETQAQGLQEQGTLALVANGEDFVRQGFVTKDGWQIDFNHVYITLNDVTAYQTNPPFDLDQGNKIQVVEEVILLEAPETVDLAEGDQNAESILVATEKAPAGTYNALYWELIQANEGVAEGQTIVLDGIAQKEGRTINFLISFDQPLQYICGQYVGNERKGILKSSEDAQVETTFHFDHIFGDLKAPADDSLNQGAIGFEPFAALAQNGSLKVDSTTLQSTLKSEDYQILESAIAGLGHVGEGHCRVGKAVTQLNQ